MLRNSFIRFITAFSFLIICLTGIAQESGNVKEISDLYKKINSIPGVDSIVVLAVSDQFSEKFELYYSQLLDAEDSTAGYFTQRVFLSHSDYTKPMIFVTEGYTADYAQNSYYSNELTRLINGNQMVVEHRYFGKSKPDSLNWDYLTVENAAHDHHVLINAFNKLYSGKWISTGISKGGQTALIHMSLFPEDLDFSVPYVAPLNFGVEDGRHEPFIDNISTEDDRTKIRDFQLTVLKKRDLLAPLFEKFCNNKAYTFRIPLEEIFDLCVLEYSFVFWQWGSDISSVPDNNASVQKLFDHLMTVSSPSYFAIEEMETNKAFFVQAWHQMGYYGYDTEPFSGLLTKKDVEAYLQKVFLPSDVKSTYEKEPMLKVQKFLDENDPKMIFIYGEFDPWSATAVEFKDKKNMLKIIKEGGSHATRINNLPEEQRKFVIETIKKWLNE